MVLLLPERRDNVSTGEFRGSFTVCVCVCVCAVRVLST